MSALPAKVVTLDMDGTCFDPWHCCYDADDTYVGSEACRHVRKDTLKRARQLATRNGAALVVLSYRHGAHRPTKEWCEAVGLDVSHVFTPWSPDAVDLAGRDHGGSQVQYKARILVALMDAGVEVVGSFDDNSDVIAMAKALGVRHAVQVKYLVDVPSDLYRQRTRYGAWRRDPAPTKAKAKRRGCRQGIPASLFDDLHS